MKVLMSIEDHLARSALAHRDRVALVDTGSGVAGSWGEITYARLVELVRAQAAGLDQLGVDRGACVAVVTRSSARLLTSFLAVSGTGRVLVPVDVRMSVGDMASVIVHSGATMLLVDPEFDRVVFHDLTERCVVFGSEHGDEELYRFRADAEPWAPVDDAIAILEYTTSATTRCGPGARTHRDLRSDLAAFGWQLNLSERDVYLHTLPLCQSRAWGLAYALTAMGALQVGFDTIDAVEILRRVDAYGVTVIDDAPTTERVQAELGWEFVSVSGLTHPAVVAVPSRPSRVATGSTAAGLAPDADWASKQAARNCPEPVDTSDIPRSVGWSAGQQQKVVASRPVRRRLFERFAGLRDHAHTSADLRFWLRSTPATSGHFWSSRGTFAGPLRGRLVDVELCRLSPGSCRRRGSRAIQFDPSPGGPRLMRQQSLTKAEEASPGETIRALVSTRAHRTIREVGRLCKLPSHRAPMARRSCSRPVC